MIAPANPLRGVASDSTYLASVLASIKGPIVLAGHSYGGEVLTNAATGNPKVKALVYIAAFAPDQGETSGALSTKFPGSQLTPHNWCSVSSRCRTTRAARTRTSTRSPSGGSSARTFPSRQQP